MEWQSEVTLHVIILCMLSHKILQYLILNSHAVSRWKSMPVDLTVIPAET